MARLIFIAALVLLWTSGASASFSGPIPLPLGAFLVFGVLGALPGGLVILALEWKVATWKPPRWLGALAALPLGYFVLRATGIVGPDGGQGFLLAIPALIELVLITFVASPRVRRAVVVAAATLLLLGLVPSTGSPTGSQRAKEGWGMISGGALATALLWQVGVSLRKRSLRGPHIGSRAGAAVEKEGA